MKKLWIFIALWGMLWTACTDNTDDLWDSLNELEQRVTDLEELCNQMNANIASLQSIVNASQQGDYITGISPLMQNGEEIGYTITFAKNAPITIYHGNSPVIGVKEEKGVYYWTLNGEWLTDGGTRIMAEGMTPQLKIEEGYWYVSQNNGVSWTRLGKATGEEGNAIFESVTQDDDYVYFVLADGTSFIVSKYDGVSVTFSQQEDILIFWGKTTEVTYSIIGGGVNPAIEADAPAGWDVDIAKSTAYKGTITVTCPAMASSPEEITVRVVGDDGVTANAVLTFVAEDPAAELYIPDANFKAYLLQTVDMDSNGILTNGDATAWNNSTRSKTMDVSHSNIRSLEGIQYFTELTNLDCQGNLLTELDLSACTKLMLLYCQDNQLTELNVSGCSALLSLYCQNNQLVSLDIDICTSLSTLYCWNNSLTKLNVSNCTSLIILYCQNNQLENLQLNRCLNLQYLQCQGNNLVEIDISTYSKIISITCTANQLTTLDVSHACALTFLSCDNNRLTSLNLEGCVALTSLSCNTNQLRNLDLSDCTELASLYCSSNQLTTLDVSMTSLGYSSNFPLYCKMSTLKSLTLKTGWRIHRINENRSSDYISDDTEIVYRD